MTDTNDQNPQITARQAQRMLHLLRKGRGRLAAELDYAGRGNLQEERRELQAIDELIAEVTPIIWPRPDVPPGLQDRNGNTG